MSQLGRDDKGSPQLRNRDEFDRSVHSFDWIQDAAPGATDLDCVIEKNGHFLVLEGKTWRDGVTVPLGQHIALKALARPKSFTVILVGEHHDVEDGGQRFSTVVHGVYEPYNKGAHRHFPPGIFAPADEDDMRQLVRRWITEAGRRG